MSDDATCRDRATAYASMEEWEKRCNDYSGETVYDLAAEVLRLRAELQQSRLNHLTTLSELQDAAEQSRRLRAERDEERDLSDQLFNTLHAYYRLGSLMMDPLLRRVFNDYKEARRG